jgi:HEAT repeat protein
VAHRGPEADRLMFSKAVVEALAGQAPADVKVFLLEDMSVAGGPEMVAAAAALLPDETLGEHAAFALGTIGGEEAKKALRDAMPKATGGRKATIIIALGTLKDAAAVPLITAAATDTDESVVKAALWALTYIGDGASGGAVRGTAETPRKSAAS